MGTLAGVSVLCGVIDRWVTRVTLVCACFIMTALIAATTLDVAIRQIAHIGSDKLKELESCLFLALVMISIGYAYLRDGHVRIDIARERAAPRTRAWVEMVGCIAIMMPLSAVLIYHGFDSALSAYSGGERPEAFSDLPIQWAIKATVPVGYLLLLLSGVCVAARNLLFLCGMASAPSPQGEQFLSAKADPQEGVQDP